MLDVQQIFGRAGRPQFEDEGLGIIITQHAQLAHYLGMLTHQTPIESKFTDPLVDNLNAEIVLGETSKWCLAALQMVFTSLAKIRTTLSLSNALTSWLTICSLTGMHNATTMYAACSAWQY